MVRNLINLPPRPAADSLEFVSHLVDADAGFPDGEIASVWDAVGLLALDDIADERPVAVVRRRPIQWAALAALLVATVGMAVFWQQRPAEYRTEAGQQMTVSLNDGSTIILNTASDVQVRFHGRQRDIRLVSGEAYFRVAHRTDRDPFFVTSGGARIRVTGTRFAVNLHANGNTDVDLLDGRILVGKASDTVITGKNAIAVSAGEALRLGPDGRVVAKRPAAALYVDAWLNHRAYFYDMSLADAVAEMNRYRTRPMTIRNPAVARNVRVTGVFQATDSRTFANAVRGLYGVEIDE